MRDTGTVIDFQASTIGDITIETWKVRKYDRLGYYDTYRLRITRRGERPRTTVLYNQASWEMNRIDATLKAQAALRAKIEQK